MKPTVTCATCGTGYPAIFESSDQGHECAATVQGKQMMGHYGSTVIDMEIWEFKGPRPEEIKEGTICDPCIVKLQEAKKIARKRTGVW